MFPPVDQARRQNSFLRIVAGLDVPPEASTPVAPAPQQPPRKGRRRRPYKHQQERKYQDGVPVIDPAGEKDEIFRFIAEHRAAAAHYDRCVTVENDAEGKVSDNEFSRLQRNTHQAFEQMMFFARCVIIHRPTTRRGLIHQARYLCLAVHRPGELRERRLGLAGYHRRG
jgi:hypothetical protein